MDSGFVSRHRSIVRRRSSLFSQGEWYKALYVIVSGCLKLQEVSPDGAERIVAFRVAGELVGLEGWSRGQHPHSAIALNDAAVCELAWPLAQGADSVAVLERLLLRTTAQLDHTKQPWAGLPAVERVEAFLRDFAARSPVQDRPWSETALPMTRAEIGSYLGLAEETVVRALAKLRTRDPASCITAACP